MSSQARPPTLVEYFRAMVLMRDFEEACAQGVKDGDLRGELHLAVGQESAPAALLGLLRPEDWIVGTHRSHPFALVKGIDPYPLLAEVFEKSTGLCGGKGGHLHLFSKQHRFSTTGIVGSSLPVALGHAYAATLERADYVAIGVTGDGGSNTGQFFETLNMASVWSMPLVLLVENNGFGISVPSDEVTAGGGVVDRAAAFGIWAAHVDGVDVEAVARTMGSAITHARSGSGPAVVEVTCQRFSGHYEGDPDHYRSAALKADMRRADPIAATRQRLLDLGGATEQALDGIETEIRGEVTELLARVRSDPNPERLEATRGVFVEELASAARS